MDGMTIDEFPAFAREHCKRIRSQLRAGTYRPAPVRRVQAGWELGLCHAVDCDLKAFFETVNHDRLLGALRNNIGSG